MEMSGMVSWEAGTAWTWGWSRLLKPSLMLFAGLDGKAPAGMAPVGWNPTFVVGICICVTVESASRGFMAARGYSAIFRDCSNMLRPAEMTCRFAW
jgi:hypothetical protein